MERGPSPASVIHAYLGTLRAVLFKPFEFFSRMPLRGGLAGPLAFALTTHWIGHTLNRLWATAAEQSFSRWIKGNMQRMLERSGGTSQLDSLGGSQNIDAMRERLWSWMMGTGSILLDPFKTLIAVTFTGALVWLGARLMVTPGKNGAPSEITYEGALRIVCYAMAPALLAATPLIGGSVASIWILIVTVIGAKEVYRIDLGRAIVVGLFPKVLFWGSIAFFSAFFLVSILTWLLTRPG